MIDSENLSANAYELLIQSVVDYAIYLLDPKGHVVSWNPGAERIKGYTADEIIGTHFSRFYTDEDRAAGVPEHALKIAAEPAGSPPKPGDAVRMAVASGLWWPSTPSAAAVG